MLPISKPFISNLEIELVTEAVQSGWVSSLGHYIEQFERDFGIFCGVVYALTVSNGTVGLHLALATLGIKEGAEVIVPDLTFVATANAVRMSGAIPIPVDVDRSTYCISISAIEAAITPNTRAIVPVHLYGYPANMPEILKLAYDNNLLVIEDAAEAHGASIGCRFVGSFGDFGVFSFYGNKILTTGEGGMLTTNNYEHFKRARHLRDHAMSKEKRYWHTELGYNYRMTNLQAALGVAQLQQVEQFLRERRQILDQYRNRLEQHGIECNPKGCDEVNPVNWITCAVLPNASRIVRDKVILMMAEAGVDSRPFFYPLSDLPMYESAPNPVSQILSSTGINLPTYIGITPDEIDIVSTALLNACINCGLMQ